MQRPTSQQAKVSQRWLKQHKTLAGWLPILTVASAAGAGMLLVAQAYLLAQVASAVMFAEKSLAQVSDQLWLILALLLIRAVLVAVSERFAIKGAVRVKQQLRTQLLDRVVALGPVWLESQRSGELVNCLHEGVEALEAYYARYLPAVALSAFLPLVILALVLPIDWRTGLIFLVTAPLIPMFMILVGRQAEQKNQQHWQQLTRMGGYFLDRIRGLTQLRLLNASRRELQLIAQLSDQFRRDTLSVLKIAFLSSVVLEFFATISIALVAVTVGFRLYWGEMDFSTGLLVLLLAPEFYLPLRNLGNQYHARLAGVSAALQMQEILQTEPSQNKKLSTQRLNFINQISFSKVDFSHLSNHKALSAVDLTIQQPGLYALVGASGAGKSTLVDMLLRFIYPQSGQYRINQTDLSEFSELSIQQQFAWIPQQPTLFYGSVFDNIALSYPDASMDEVRQAARQAGADDFISQLSDGYQTLLGERGMGLSGGQCQRIALARAFLKRASVLVLDEPSAHLDQQTERQVQQAITDYAKQHIVIVIAHRLHTVRDAKCIWVMDAGEIVQQGSHIELLKQDGLYQRMLSVSGASASAAPNQFPDETAVFGEHNG